MKVQLNKYQDIKSPNKEDFGYRIYGSWLKKFSEGKTDVIDEKLYSFHYAQPSYAAIYSGKSKNDYWIIIKSWIFETKAKEDHKDFLQRYKNDPKFNNSKLMNIINKLNNEQIDKKSFINFVRHFPVLEDYIDDKNYNISSIDGVLRLHLWHHGLNLVLHFKSDFLIDFYSYDKNSEDYKDHLVYSMKGSFSSSSSLDKSYKIEILLSIFDKIVRNNNGYYFRNLEKTLILDKYESLDIFNNDLKRKISKIL